MSDHGFAEILDAWEKNLQKKEDKPTKPRSNFARVLGAFEKKSPAHDPEGQKIEDVDLPPRLSPQKTPIQGVLDLHGMTILQAEAAVRSFAKQSRAAGYKKVLIIHGKGNHSKDGNSKLRGWLIRFLETQSWAGSRGKADKDHGGSGATWVMIKYYRSR
ncbi:MAG: Smr/MutS family protein [Spirochaetales bacterium]|nr:Smr/MutS family protein [Spirochaetales bacterium]